MNELTCQFLRIFCFASKKKFCFFLIRDFIVKTPFLLKKKPRLCCSSLFFFFIVCYPSKQSDDVVHINFFFSLCTKMFVSHLIEQCCFRLILFVCVKSNYIYPFFCVCVIFLLRNSIIIMILLDFKFDF